MRSKQLGQLLLENGDVNADQVAKALKAQEQQGGLIGQILQQMGACTATAVSASLLKQVQVTDVTCDDLTVDPEVYSLVPRETCEAEKLCPFERLGNLLCVVMGNPLNRKAITAIEEKTRLKVKSFKSVWPKISDLIQRTYDSAEVPPEESVEAEPLGDEGGLPSLDLGDDAGGGMSDAPGLELDEPAYEPEPEPVRAQTAPRTIPIQAYKPKPRPPEVPAGPKIKGFDNMDDASAEVVATDKRGLSPRAKRHVAEMPYKPKVEKIAKVNVNLDEIDLSEGEVLQGSDFGDAPGGGVLQAARPVTRPMKLKLIDDTFFYDNGSAPKQRAPELLGLIEKLPVAETVAQSIGDYQAQQKEKMSAVELQQVPTAAMSAVLISDAEFQKEVSVLRENPVGEWDWQYAACGPVPVMAFDE